jgi:hypothetical protein
MQADVDVNDQARTSSLPEKRTAGERPAKPIECPFEVRIDGAVYDQFYDVRDALASARAAKRNKCGSIVVVTDVRTGKLVIEVQT